MPHGTTGNLDKYIKIAMDDIAHAQETRSLLKGKLPFLPRLLKMRPKEPLMCGVARKRAAE